MDPEARRDTDELKGRLKRFALAIVRCVDGLPKARTASTLGGQLLRAGTSSGANYRAACRAKSNRDFVYKLGVVEEELDETLFWLELLTEAEIAGPAETRWLAGEANELLSITVRGGTRRQ